MHDDPFRLYGILFVILSALTAPTAFLTSLFLTEKLENFLSKHKKIQQKNTTYRSMGTFGKMMRCNQIYCTLINSKRGLTPQEALQLKTFPLGLKIFIIIIWTNMYLAAAAGLFLYFVAI